MYCAQTREKLNCNHKIELYFEIGSKWTLEDYCLQCKDAIRDIEAEDETRKSLRRE